MFAGFALAAVACGGDGGPGSDEEYVKAVCQAVNRSVERSAEIEDEIDEIMAGADNEDEALEEVFKLTAKPISDFANDLAKAKPPADMKEFHDQVVDAFKTHAKQLEDGDREALVRSAGAFDFLEPPQAIQDRLNAVAANTSECDDSDFFN